jgi:SAM-dependent methyltransferase
MDQNPGLHDFFASGFYEEYWPEAGDPESAKAQAAQVLSLLNASDGHILDWRGGHGRYAIWFARKGLQVTLLDFMGEYLEVAKTLFDEAGLPVRLIEVDSRHTPPDVQADFAVCLNNSVGFMSEEEEIKAFASLNAALRPGARLLLDCMNLFFLMKPIAEGLTENQVKGDRIRRSKGRFDFKTNVWHKTFQLERPDGTSVQKEFNQTIYTPQQLVNMLRRAGFTTEKLFGDLDENPVSFESEKIILVARKE